MVAAATPDTSTEGIAQRLDQADRIKTLDHARFIRLMQSLDKISTTLSDQQVWKLRYLKAWESGYRGESAASLMQLDDLAKTAGDRTLRFRAEATAINVLANVSRYQEAFERLSRLLEQIPRPSRRMRGSRC